LVTFTFFSPSFLFFSVLFLAKNLVFSISTIFAKSVQFRFRPFRTPVRMNSTPFLRSGGRNRSPVPLFLRSDLRNGMNRMTRKRTEKNHRSIPCLVLEHPFISVHERVPNPAFLPPPSLPQSSVWKLAASR